MMIHQKMYQAVRAAGFADTQIAAFEKDIADYQKKQGPAYKRGDVPPNVPANYQAAVERGWLDGAHLVLRIGANARYFTDSSSKVAIDVSMGDAAVGMSIDFYGRYQAQTSKGPNGNDRMVYLTPLGGSSVSSDPISLLRGAGGGADTPQTRRERREVAIRFIEFVLSEEGQKLWTYRPGTPGGPEKFTLRRLPVRRDFYPSTNPILNAKHLEHLRYAADNLADPQVDPYQVGEQFTYYPRWTGQHFAFHRDLIRVMCLDAGDELKAAWRSIIDHGGPAQQLDAMKALEKLPDEITWRTAPDIPKKQKKIDYTRNWTIFFRTTYDEARKQVK
jgi:ABC-type glycerol-3-phosphate transport system substrate-binding protein